MLSKILIASIVPLLTLMIALIAVLFVVPPAVWSRSPERREAAYKVLELMIQLAPSQRQGLSARRKKARRNR